MIPKKKHPYYNFNRLYSYNATYNFCVGGRGLGKTYGAKKQVIKNYIRRGEMFIYLRRYKTELVSRQTFFADIAHEFPKHDFRIHGNLAQIALMATRDTKNRDWQTMGYFISLSTAQSMKSVAFPKVTTIIFDEFIIEKGNIQYLPSEADVFNNFYSTVDRYQDKTKVLFLANSVSIMNPYFLKYEIAPDQENEFVVRSDGFIVAHFPDSEKFANSVYETNFGRFIKDTDYAEYAVSNTFMDNHDNLINPKDSNARYMFTLETKNGKFSVWFNMFTSEYTVQEKLPKQQLLFTIVPERMDSDKTLMTFNDKPMQYLRTAFRNARVTFDKPQTRNTFIEIFAR